MKTELFRHPLRLRKGWIFHGSMHPLNIVFPLEKKSSTTYELWTLSRRGTFDLRCHRNVNFDIFSHIYIWPVTQCLKTAKKVSFKRAKRATLISKKTLWWIVFAPCKFFQILGIYSVKWTERIWKNFQGAKTNHQRFKK